MKDYPCMSCKQHPATVKLTRIVKGTVEEVYLCQDCAARQSPYQKKATAMADVPATLEQLLAGILGQKGEAGAAPASTATSDLQCRTCGLPFDSYRSTLLLGCTDCYESFERLLVGDLRKFHGSTVHRGRVPDEASTYIERPRPDFAELRKRLATAVKSEDFPLAAKLRDELKDLEAAAAADRERHAEASRENSA